MAQTSTNQDAKETVDKEGIEKLVLDLLFLVSLLAHLFGQDLAVALGGQDGDALRDEVVAAVAGLHGDDVVLIS